MRIGMDITPATARPTGVGEYVLKTLRHMLPLFAEGESLHGWASGVHAPHGVPQGVHTRHLPVPTRVLYALWRKMSRPCVDRLLGGVDVFHATNYFLPPAAKARRILTIYDLAFLVEPGWASPKIVGPFSRDVPQFARDADAILTCSEHSREDIARLCGVPLNRIHVAYGAPDTAFVPEPRDAAARGTKARLGWDGPFLLFVGTLEPRKNLETLLRAFARLQARYPHRLVLAGAMGWNMGHLPELIDQLGLTRRVVLPGYLPTREDLAAAYRSADLFILPSHYEGFGLPLVEAMACGCPAVASNTSSLPEVGGDAAVYFPPGDDATLSQVIDGLLGDAGRRAVLSEKGLAQAAKFTWESTARRTLELYRSLA